MKRKEKLIYIIPIFFALCFVFTKTNTYKRYEHHVNLSKSPYTETKKLDKKTRKNIGLPPNIYYERMWELTMDPKIGRPRTENIFKIQENLDKLGSERIQGVPGENSDMAWEKRGPSNVGGRTKTAMFDPNDASNKKVFAGGVSGGLFVNNDITNDASEWTMIPGIPKNLAVSSITYDPNDKNTFYVGTGEIYTRGDALGNGLWSSNDGGVTWTNVMAGGRFDDEPVFSTNKNTVDILSPSGQSPITFREAAFGANIPGKPLAKLEGNVILSNPLNGCESLSSSVDYNGKIVLMEAPDCPYFDKVINAQAAGARAVIVHNKDTGASDWEDGLVYMGAGDNDTSSITIPAVHITQSDGEILKNLIDDGDVTVSFSKRVKLYVDNRQIVPGMFFVNDVVVRDNNGVSEVYAAVGSARWDRTTESDDGSGDSVYTLFGGGTSDGIYKSTNKGQSWEKLDMYLPSDDQLSGWQNYPVIPMDLEISNDNKIFASTTHDAVYGIASTASLGGGRIYRSNDEGSEFSLIHEIKFDYNGEQYASGRTEIEFTADDQLITLTRTVNSEGTFKPKLIKGSVEDYVNNNVTTVALPADQSFTGTTYEDDFTRGQSGYNLVIEADPNNKDDVFIGGINMFKSNNFSSATGNPWQPVSHGSSEFGLQYMHNDQHGAIINENDTDKIIFTNDGGISYSSDGGGLITPRNNKYQTTQFYTVAVAPVGMFDNYKTKVRGWNLNTGNRNFETTIENNTDVYAGGTQDNGTLLIFNNGGDSLANDIGSGDGAATMFSSNVNNKYIVINYVYNYSTRVLNMNNTAGAFQGVDDETSINWFITAPNATNPNQNGEFINTQALDSNFGRIYSNNGNGRVLAYYDWDDFQIADQGSAAPFYEINTSSGAFGQVGGQITAMKVSPFDTDSSTLITGDERGNVTKIENANDQSQSSITKTSIDSDDFIGSVSDIEFGKTKENIFVTMYNYGVENIFYSSDGGQNWLKKDGNLPDMPVYCILQNPLNEEEVIIGTDLGVWYTQNFSSTSPSWNQANAGMKDVRVTDMDIRVGDNKVFISTYGLGIFSGEFVDNQPRFLISTDASDVEIYQDNSKSVDITYNVYQNFSEVVEFSVEGLPAGCDAEFLPGATLTMDNNGSISLKIVVGSNVPVGTYPLTINATSNSMSKSLNLNLIVLSDDNDGDGVLNADDNCPDTANQNQNDIDGDLIGDVCDSNPLPNNTFSLQVEGETCRSANDGSMKLDIDRSNHNVDSEIPFTISITGGPAGFTHTPEEIVNNSWTKELMQGGDYTVCMTTSILTGYEQCFNVVIDEPQDLSVLTSVVNNGDTMNLTLSGSSNYNITHNNKTISTSDSNASIKLKKGLNTIRVTGDKECQGIYEETIFNSEDILLSPNPTSTSSRLWIGGEDKNVNVSMFDNAGRLLWTNQNDVPSSRSIDIQVSNLRAGLYYIKVDSETVKKTAKLIKE